MPMVALGAGIAGLNGSHPAELLARGRAVHGAMRRDPPPRGCPSGGPSAAPARVGEAQVLDGGGLDGGRRARFSYTGDADAAFDCCHAPGDADAMWSMLRHDEPEHRAEGVMPDFGQDCFEAVGPDGAEYVRIDERSLWSREARALFEDSSKTSDRFELRSVQQVQALARLMVGAEAGSQLIDPTSRMRVGR